MTPIPTSMVVVASPPVQLYLNVDVQPDFTTFLGRAELTNGTPPVGSISYGPPLAPGRYWFGIFNPSGVTQDVTVGVFLTYNAGAALTLDYFSAGPLALRDDAVTMSDFIFVTNAEAIQNFSVGLRVDHPRISDLVFHLVSPSGARYLLMENRGGQDTNGCGSTVITTNIINVSANGNRAPSTNFINTGVTTGTFPITYNFYSAVDEMTIYYGTNVVPANRIYDTGFTNNGPPGGPFTHTTFSISFAPTNAVTSTYLTVVMNQFGNPSPRTK